MMIPILKMRKVIIREVVDIIESSFHRVHFLEEFSTVILANG